MHLPITHVGAALGIVVTGAALAADCGMTSVGRVPLNDLGTGSYLGAFQGGLYAGGSNALPASHAAAGSARALAVLPRNPAGALDPAGAYVLLSIGMSNTTQEFSRFVQLAAANTQVNHQTLRIVDGAAGGQTASTWDSPTDANYNRVRDQVLAPMGLTEAQVQTAWLKVANPGPTIALPNANADARTLEVQQGNILRAMKTRYPNLQQVFISSRIYAGYASTTLNPEPYSYESAFGVKWVIDAQINQANGGGVDPQAGDLDFNSIAPWIAWGPYLWADGLTPRSDGLIWLCSDLQSDGTHPSTAGGEKVAGMLLKHLLDSPQSRPWFRAEQDADINNDGHVTVVDLLQVISAWGACAPFPALCPSDIDPRGGDGQVSVTDLLKVLNNWG